MAERKLIKDKDLETVGELRMFLVDLPAATPIQDVFGDRVCVAHYQEDGDDYLEVT